MADDAFETIIHLWWLMSDGRFLWRCRRMMMIVERWINMSLMRLFVRLYVMVKSNEDV